MITDKDIFSINNGYYVCYGTNYVLKSKHILFSYIDGTVNTDGYLFFKTKEKSLRINKFIEDYNKTLNTIKQTFINQVKEKNKNKDLSMYKFFNIPYIILKYEKINRITVIDNTEIIYSYVIDAKLNGSINDITYEKAKTFDSRYVNTDLFEDKEYNITSSYEHPNFFKATDVDKIQNKITQTL